MIQVQKVQQQPSQDVREQLYSQLEDYMGLSSTKKKMDSSEKSGGTTPVSYTHLDVYKRQQDEGLDLFDDFGCKRLKGDFFVVAARNQDELLVEGV